MVSTGLRHVAKVCRPFGLMRNGMLKGAGETPAIPGTGARWS